MVKYKYRNFYNENDKKRDDKDNRLSSKFAN